jgi:hypothetical protein
VFIVIFANFFKQFNRYAPLPKVIGVQHIKVHIDILNNLIDIIYVIQVLDGIYTSEARNVTLYTLSITLITIIIW